MPTPFFKTYAAATAETGLSEWTLAAIKRASKGQPDSPFNGRIIDRVRLLKWLQAHPGFVATQILRPTASTEEADAPSARRNQAPLPLCPSR